VAAHIDFRNVGRPAGTYRFAIALLIIFKDNRREFGPLLWLQ
jgi:hypothetical protein